MKVIVNSDDFGYSRAVNYGIIDAFLLGVLTSTTCMTNTPGFDHAIQLSKQHPKLGVGVHLVLTHGAPVLKKVNSLTNAEGNFHHLHYYEDHQFFIDSNELYEEWKAQILKFLDAGLVPTHLDSHHHIHSFGNNYQVFIRLAKEFNLPVRNNFRLASHIENVKTTDVFAGELDASMFEHHQFEQMTMGAQSVEIMCHPAYIDSHLLSSSTFVYPRLEEYELLCSLKAKEFFDQNQYTLCTFNDL